jgi:hypothetical protein
MRPNHQVSTEAGQLQGARSWRVSTCWWLAQLRARLDAQHYTRGLAFVSPGTPTNNTPAGPAGFPPPDPGGAASFAIEQGAPLVDASSPAGAYSVAFAHAFGLPVATGEQVAAVEHLANANIDGDTAASTINQALWPATLGYFLEQLMAPEFDAPTIEAAREFWVNRVRPGGPLPTFRVGNVPYGILPAVSLDRLDTDGRFTPESAPFPYHRRDSNPPW